jgi:predicted nucleic acid-binding protein
VAEPAAILAETLCADARDVRANQALKKLQVVPLTELVARAAARLKRLAGMTGAAVTIDAIVVATSAAAGGGIVLTSDFDDIRALSTCAPRIRPVRI